MKSNFKLIKALTLVVSVVASTPVLAAQPSTAFTSIHQTAGITYRDNFSPSNVGDGSFQCFSLFGFPGYSYTGGDLIKVYIPEGTVRIDLHASLPQTQEASAALRFDNPPENTYTNSSRLSIDGIFKELFNNPDGIVVSHDGSGTYTMGWGWIGGGLAASKPLSSGHWLYMDLSLQHADLYQFEGNICVDAKVYREGYSKITFSTNGDPVDGFSGTGGASSSSATKPVQINQSQAATVGSTVTESTDADGNLVLNMQFSPATEDKGYAANIFIAASTKDGGMFVRDSTNWVSLADIDPQLLSNPILLNVIKFASIESLQNSNQLVLPVGFGKADLKKIGVYLYLGYQVGSSQLVIGEVWK